MARHSCCHLNLLSSFWLKKYFGSLRCCDIYVDEDGLEEDPNDDKDVKEKYKDEDEENEAEEGEEEGEEEDEDQEEGDDE